MQIKLNLSGHQNDDLAEKGFVFPGTIQINPEKGFDENLISVTNFLKAQGVSSGSTVTVAVPGMSTLTVMVLVALHGLTGQFPFVAPLVRNENGKFVSVEEVDLQLLRNNVSRLTREDVVNL